MKPSWSHFSHSADIGIRGDGPTLASAFEQAARALFAIVTDVDRIRAVTEIDIGRGFGSILTQPPSTPSAAMTPINGFLQKTRIAYFSMEIALRPEIHTYSGGLGILAGDTARSCADLELPVVFVTLISRAGYFRQTLDEHGRQVEQDDSWNPAEWAIPLAAKIALSIEDREVWVRPWLHVYTCPVGHQTPILFLDTDLEENDPEDRKLTHHLYGGDTVYRLKQEIVLGVGGARLLQALGFSIHTYHLNEGHAAFLAVELLHRFKLPAQSVHDNGAYDTARVRAMCIFTTHTPVDAGHDRFSYELVERVIGSIYDLNEIKLLGGTDVLNMTQLALNLSGYVNGVAQRHAKTATQMFPGFHIRAITNGVHVGHWTHASFAALYDANFSSWSHEPDALVRADQLDDAAVWQAHCHAKTDFLSLVKRETGILMNEERPVIAFARRMTGYKRPTLLFTDINRLAEMGKERPFQIVVAGKAHPRDSEGKVAIEEINGYIRSLGGAITAAYLPNYDIRIAQAMVAGADLWLNTPQPPLEASGTSGMKAALNGVLNLSILDGWWIEACLEGVTGWAIDGPDAKSAQRTDAELLYGKLERTILPLYYDDRGRWIWMMKQGISKISSYFNSQRMMRRYASEAYLR